MKERAEDLIRNETATCAIRCRSAKNDAQIMKDRADGLTRNETSASAKTGAKKSRGAEMVKSRAEDLAHNETATGAKTGAQKCTRLPARTCTTFAARPKCESRGPATSFPSVLKAILG